MTEGQLLHTFTESVRIVNKPTHMSVSLIDHFCIKKTLMEEFLTNLTVENIYFEIMMLSELKLRKMLLIFILLHKTQYD